MSPQNYKIIIVGGGPAGLATALFLAQQAPALAEQTLIIESKQHPRPKLCGGGVTFHGAAQLERLGIHLDVPAFVVDRLVFRLGRQAFEVRHDDAMRIYERAEFDAALARTVIERGLCIHPNEQLLDMTPAPGGMLLTTNRDRYFTPVVVGADGANSTVRRKLKLASTLGVARLLRSMTPVTAENDRTWRDRTAVFDFSCVQEGIQGYMWDFPCFLGGQAYMNHGIFDSRVFPQPASARQHGQLKRSFMDGLAVRGVDTDTVPLEGHPVRWFNPQAAFSQPHVLLAGDAAGVDPLFAEGISYAMEYGLIVAETIQDAFARDDFSFSTYRARLLHHELGRLLRRRGLAARQLYGYRIPEMWSIFWKLATIAPKRVQNKFGAVLALLPP